MAMDANGRIELVQFNAASRNITHDLFMMWLATATNPIIVCVQEPCIRKQGLLRLPRGFTSFWSNKAKIKSEPGIELDTVRMRGVITTTTPNVRHYNHSVIPGSVENMNLMNEGDGELVSPPSIEKLSKRKGRHCVALLTNDCKVTEAQDTSNVERKCKRYKTARDNNADAITSRSWVSIHTGQEKDCRGRKRVVSDTEGSGLIIFKLNKTSDEDQGIKGRGDENSVEECSSGKDKEVSQLRFEPEIQSTEITNSSNWANGTRNYPLGTYASSSSSSSSSFSPSSSSSSKQYRAHLYLSNNDRHPVDQGLEDKDVTNSVGGGSNSKDKKVRLIGFQPATQSMEFSNYTKGASWSRNNTTESSPSSSSSSKCSKKQCKTVPYLGSNIKTNLIRIEPEPRVSEGSVNFNRANLTHYCGSNSKNTNISSSSSLANMQLGISSNLNSRNNNKRKSGIRGEFDNMSKNRLQQREALCNKNKVRKVNCEEVHSNKEMREILESKNEDNIKVSRKKLTIIKKGRQRVRALIIASKCLNGYMVSQHSNVDCVTVRFEDLKISVISLYCDINMDINLSMSEVCKEQMMRHNLIICADTNARCCRWGALGYRKKSFKVYRRGEQMSEILDELHLTVCNVIPHLPTFVGDAGHSSHIDATFCSDVIASRIREWRVCREQFESDHRIIKFVFYIMGSPNMDVTKEFSHGNPWLRPSNKMENRMKVCLPRMIKYKRRIRNEFDVDIFVQKHSEEVHKALQNIFKKQQGNKRTPCYWWTEEVKHLHKCLKVAKRRMHRYKFENLKSEYNLCRKKFRNKVCEAKLNAWKEFTSSISDPWKGLMKILTRENANKAQERTLCSIDGVYADSLEETLWMLSEQFYPCPIKYSEAHYQIEEEVNKSLAEVNEGESITVCEFKKALGEMKKATAPGKDGITNCVLQILVKECQMESLYVKLFNVCLKDGVFPLAWKQARIVLIPKAVDLGDSVKAMRPISLTSVFSKLLERIVLARILHYMELSGKLSLSQHAYRKGGSTTTALFEAAKFIQDALHDKHICVCVFLDISGAFDRTWHYGILFRLLQYGVPKYLVKWVKSFLSNRPAEFCAAGTQHKVELEQGCPQGGVLSPVLWNVLFNDMLVMKTKADQNFHLKVVGYADDAALLCRAKNVKNASVILTNYLVRIKDWAEKNRVQFNQSKLKVMVISKGSMVPPASVYFSGILIDEVSQYKYLGLIFDKRLTWKPHVNNLLDKLTKVTRMLRRVVREKWGVKMDIMRMLFKTIFCPILFYGIAIWGWKMTKVTMCAKFDSVIRKFCIMSTRCFRSTSNEVLFRMMKTSKFSSLLLQEVLRVAGLQLNLMYSQKDHVFNREPMMDRKNPISMEHFFYICRQGVDIISKDIVYDNLLHSYAVHPTNWISTKTFVRDRIDAMWNGVNKMGWIIYTDASVSSYGAGCAYVVYHHGFCMKIQGYALSLCSIFTAKSQAVRYAVQYTKSIAGLKEKEIVEIRCDSQAVIKALEKVIITDPVLKEVNDGLRDVKKKGINIVLSWVPSHAGIEGNEMADRCAKSAVDSLVTREVAWVKRDLRISISKKNRRITERDWNCFKSRIPKLFFPEASNFMTFLESSPSVDLCQLVSGHCRLNEFLCNKMLVLNSSACSCNKGEETVEHYLFECSMYDRIRKNIWNDCEVTFEVIRNDWKKVDEYILKTKRFI